MTTSVAPLLVVADIERSVAFYGAFGFTPAVEWETYARLELPDGAASGTLHLATAGDGPPDRPGVALGTPPSIAPSTVPSIVVLQVADCAAAADAARAAGVKLLGDPAQPPWGGEIRAFLHDPDGHLVELNQRLA